MSLEPCSYIYVLFRPNDGSPCYVGKGSKTYRPDEHARCARLGKHSNRHLMNLYKVNDFVLPAVIIRSCLTEAEAFVLEKAMIAAIGKFPHGPLVNITDGGEGVSGLKPSKETIERIRKSKIGKKQSPETIERRSAIMRGKKRSEETRAKMSAAQKEASKHRKSSAGTANPFYGRSHNDQTREKLREANRLQRERNGGRGICYGRPQSEDHKEKLRIAHTGKVISDAHKEKLRAAAILQWERQRKTG